MRMLDACLWGGWVHSMRMLGASMGVGSFPKLPSGPRPRPLAGPPPRTNLVPHPKPKRSRPGPGPSVDPGPGQGPSVVPMKCRNDKGLSLEMYCERIKQVGAMNVWQPHRHISEVDGRVDWMQGGPYTFILGKDG